MEDIQPQKISFLVANLALSIEAKERCGNSIIIHASHKHVVPKVIHAYSP